MLVVVVVFFVGCGFMCMVVLLRAHTHTHTYTHRHTRARALLLLQRNELVLALNQKMAEELAERAVALQGLINDVTKDREILRQKLADENLLAGKRTEYENAVAELKGKAMKLTSELIETQSKMQGEKGRPSEEYQMDFGVPQRDRHTSMVVTSELMWVDDNARTHCFVCNKKFNTARRKHHCRICGEVVCQACSPLTHVPGAKKKVRGCLKCTAKSGDFVDVDQRTHCFICERKFNKITLRKCHCRTCGQVLCHTCAPFVEIPGIGKPVRRCTKCAKTESPPKLADPLATTVMEVF